MIMTQVKSCNTTTFTEHQIPNQHINKNLQSQLGSFFENRESIPAVNINETANEFNFEVAAPGYTNQELNIELDRGIITISANKKTIEIKGTKFKRQEFTPTSFKRSFRLPENKVDESNILATYNAGILKIVLAKLETAKPKAKRVIEVE